MVAVEPKPGPGEDNSGHMTTQLKYRTRHRFQSNLEKFTSRGFAVLLAPDWHYTDAHRSFRSHLIGYFLASVLRIVLLFSSPQAQLWPPPCSYKRVETTH